MDCHRVVSPCHTWLMAGAGQEAARVLLLVHGIVHAVHVSQIALAATADPVCQGH